MELGVVEDAIEDAIEEVIDEAVDKLVDEAADETGEGVPNADAMTPTCEMKPARSSEAVELCPNTFNAFTRRIAAVINIRRDIMNCAQVFL